MRDYSIFAISLQWSSAAFAICKAVHDIFEVFVLRRCSRRRVLSQNRSSVLFNFFLVRRFPIYTLKFALVRYCSSLLQSRYTVRLLNLQFVNRHLIFLKVSSCVRVLEDWRFFARMSVRFKSYLNLYLARRFPIYKFMFYFSAKLFYCRNLDTMVVGFICNL